jgi:hypothetical protein
MGLGGGAEVAKFALAGGGGIETKGHGKSVTGAGWIEVDLFRFGELYTRISKGVMRCFTGVMRGLQCAWALHERALRSAFDKGRAGCLRFSFLESISFEEVPG